jgi:O-antigen ligase
MIFAFPLGFGLYLLAKNRWERVYYFGALALIGLGCVITGNRTDLLGLMVSITIVVLSFALRSPSLRKTVLKFATVSVVAVLTIMTVRENNSFRRLFMPDEWDSHTASGRTLLIKEGIRMFHEQPLTGVGVGQYIHNQNYRDPTTGEFLVSQHAHNFVAQITAETGAIGATAFLILIVNAFRFLPVTWRNRKASELDLMCFMLFVSCISLLSQGFIENSLFYFQTSSLFWMGVGIWRGRALERLDKEE